MTAIYETSRARVDRELREAIADWHASTGPGRDRDRRHAMRLLRTERLRRDAERTAVKRKSAANRMRKAAENLRIIASQFDWQADASTDQRETIAFDLAMIAVEDAAFALENGANAIEGVFEPMEAA